MVEANPTIAPQPSIVIAAVMTQAQRQAIAMRQARAVRVETIRRAKAKVKHELAAQGRRKVSQVPMREIVAAAEARLLADAAYRAKLIAEARAVVDRWTAEGFFGKRAALAAHNSRISSKEERPATQGLSLNETHAQNGAGK
jgi:hypothetical protein